MTKLQDIKQSFGGWEAVMFVNFALHHQKKWYKIHKWKKNSKKSVAKLFFTTNHNPTAEVEHRVSRALQNIDLKQNIVFIEAWSTDPIRSTGSAERILDF